MNPPDPIERLIAGPIILNEDPRIDDELRMRLTYDLAHGLHDYSEIARRYGLNSDAELYAYLRAHSKIVEEARRLRSINSSDQGTEDRCKLKGQLATEELIPHIAALAANPHVSPRERIDAFKELRTTGSVGAKTGQQNATPTTGTTFAINFMFSNGAERISTTVVDAAAIPAPTGATEDDIPDEEV
jgi:hypothetical protein